MFIKIDIGNCLHCINIDQVIDIVYDKRTKSIVIDFNGDNELSFESTLETYTNLIDSLNFTINDNT